MAINNISWTEDDLITASKLAGMVEDETNSTDDIHPQYGLSKFNSFIEQKSYVDGNITVDEQWHLLRLFQGTSISLALWWENMFPNDVLSTHPFESKQTWFYLAPLNIDFINNLNIQNIDISIDLVEKTGATGTWSNADLRLRVKVYSISLDNTHTLIATSSEKNIITGTTWTNYLWSGLDISSAGQNEIITVKIEFYRHNDMAINDTTGFYCKRFFIKQ